MTNDEILQAAKEAGMTKAQGEAALFWYPEIERFAAIIENIVEKRTIERCAVTSWNHYMETCKKHGHGPDVESIRDFCSAAAIRKLGEQE